MNIVLLGSRPKRDVGDGWASMHPGYFNQKRLCGNICNVVGFFHILLFQLIKTKNIDLLLVPKKSFDQ